MRGSHTLASILSRFLSRFQVFRWNGNPYYGISLPRRVVHLWWLLEYISVLPVILFRYLIPRGLGRVVVADRYIPDFIVWVSIITHNPSFKESLYSRQLQTLSRKDTIRYYITASEGEINRRSEGEIMRLEEQKRLNSSLAVDAYKIDTTHKTPRESLREIVTILQGLGYR